MGSRKVGWEFPNVGWEFPNVDWEFPTMHVPPLREFGVGELLMTVVTRGNKGCNKKKTIIVEFWVRHPSSGYFVLPTRVQRTKASGSTRYGSYLQSGMSGWTEKIRNSLLVVWFAWGSCGSFFGIRRILNCSTDLQRVIKFSICIQVEYGALIPVPMAWWLGYALASMSGSWVRTLVVKLFFLV